MADEKTNEDKIEVFESKDGSATVDLPENLMGMADDDHSDDLDARDSGQSGDQNDDSGEGDGDDDVRLARRSRRKAKKELIRRTNQEKDVRLQQLQRENEEFKRRLSQLERNTKTENITRLDKGIEDAQVRLEYAKMKLAEATQNQDGQAMVEAQTLWQNAQEEARQLAYAKSQAENDLRRQPVNMPDPSVQRNAAEWIRKNSWYRIDGSDDDSRIAKKVDELMVTQGWDPKDPDYWDELDRRLQKELPHRYNDSDEGDSREVRRPRNVVGSSGREASAAYGGVNRTQFVLSPERVKAMKDAGAWDNPERKARMIKQFITYDRANGIRN